MKIIKFFIIILLALFFTLIAALAQNNTMGHTDFPVLKGPYLGQKPPGMKAEIFATGIVCTKKDEALFGFFNSGTRFLFSQTEPGFSDWKNEPVYMMEMRQGVWSRPRLSTFIGKPWYLNLKPFPPGKSLYYARYGGDTGDAKTKQLDIWKVKGTADGWSKPIKLPPPINSNTIDTFPSVSPNGTLYFFSGRQSGLGRDDIYLSKLNNGEHLTVENLGPAINSAYYDIDPFIAPDDSYLIFCSNRPAGFGEIDIYVSFQTKNGAWSSAVNLGENINSSVYDWVPFISSDGKYLFFISNRSGNYDIYWVDAKILDRLKPKELK